MPGGGAEAAEPVHVWCINHVVFNPSSPEHCDGLDTVAVATHQVSPGFLASVPIAKRGNGNPIRIGPDTRSVVVEFHDLDTISGAVLPH